MFSSSFSMWILEWCYMPYNKIDKWLEEAEEVQNI